MSIATWASLPEIGSDGTLGCPRCGGEYLHHLAVVIHDRQEDDREVVRTVVGRDVLERKSMSNASSGNPSSRRDGVAILFYCENCHGDEDSDDGEAPLLELTLAQVKGQTVVAWREVAVETALQG